MAIFTVAITGVTPNPEVYGGLTAATAYVGASFGATSTAWLALSVSQQGQTMVMATRFLDQQAWDGAATGLAGGTPTTLQFPRTGLTKNGEDVDSTTVPPEIVQAQFELAVIIASNPDVVAAVDQGSNVSSVQGGGGVGVSFFAPATVANGTATRLPVVVQRLVGRFLAAPGASIEGGFGQAGCSTSAMARDRQLNLIGPE